ncbi:MAG: hypothetical protein QOC87_294 [Actinomycetota bacterium]|nr:hypothetical protein [Actinomycetota bacterium]
MSVLANLTGARERGSRLTLMPVYEYACTACGERTEARQSFDDPPLEECPVCGGKLRKLYSPVGVVFKGSGFYSTDAKSSSKSSSSSKERSESSAASTSDKPTSDKGNSREPSKESSKDSSSSSTSTSKTTEKSA